VNCQTERNAEIKYDKDTCKINSFFSFYRSYIAEMGTERNGFRVGLHFSDSELDPDLNFWEKVGSAFGMNGMVYIECM